MSNTIASKEHLEDKGLLGVKLEEAQNHVAELIEGHTGVEVIEDFVIGGRRYDMKLRDHPVVIDVLHEQERYDNIDFMKKNNTAQSRGYRYLRFQRTASRETVKKVITLVIENIDTHPTVRVVEDRPLYEVAWEKFKAILGF